MTQPQWDDERLNAAFRDKFDRPAPLDIEKAVLLRIAGTSPARFTAFRRGGAGWALAAAAVVVVLVGTLTVGLGGLGLTTGSPSPSASAAHATPDASATPTEQAIPGSVFGLPIIDVPAAIAIRDAGADDREFAVHGWFTPAPTVSCPFTPTVNPLQLQCPDELTWLTRDAESLIHLGSPQSRFDQPVGPGLNPDLDGLDTTWFPGPPTPGLDDDSTPIDVVFVGHFDDRRAASCPKAEQAACRDRFVVDSVAMVHGSTTKADRISPVTATTRSSSSDVEAIVAGEAPDSPILSMTIVTKELYTFEPTIGNGHSDQIEPDTVWIVRVLESERISTYLVVDGSDAIYEMNTEGAPILVGGTPPTAKSSASPRAWPPAGATVVDLSNGIGKPPVQVAIVDTSGRLTSVVAPSDTNVVNGVDGFGAFGEPGRPGRVNLSWIGGECDSQVTVTVAADLRSISFDMGPRPDCDSIGVGHQLLLDFSGSVDVPSIQVGEATAVASPPAPQGPENVVDCGPLAPDTCQAKAHDIVDASAGKPILTISFTDECGSYTATYVDGNGVSAIIDCIPGPSPS